MAEVHDIPWWAWLFFGWAANGIAVGILHYWLGWWP